MKTLGIDHGDIIRLSIDENGQITHSSWEHSKTSVDEVQKMVDKLIRLKMITLGKEEIMVSVCIWGIDETDDYYIETFHGEDDLSDDDVTMKYTEFLNTK